MKRILLRVLFIVLAAFTGLMATVNPATLILTALSIFAAVKVDFFAGRKEDTGRKPVYRWAWLWAVAIFVGTVAFSVAGVSDIDSTAAADLSRGVPTSTVTEEEPDPAEEADGFGQEPAEEPVPVEEPEPEPEPVQAEPEPEPQPEPEPAPTPEPEPAAEPVPVAEPEPVAAEPASVNYVGNKNTGKFHLPSCSSVSDMNESNKLYWTGSRDELIAQGYVPCGRCHP